MSNVTIDRTPQVSVVIPAYNCADYVGQAVDSVLHQTYANWEIIVVDDGSKDDTRLVLEKYGDRIRYIYQKNQGVSIARNHGIELARGEFIAFL
ncbi:glycosyltransferase family A protein, partial [Microcoleus sp. HI-ES]|nr:glycosyltransferase family A protein [Microcoleus sp. HI-ES]